MEDKLDMYNRFDSRLNHLVLKDEKLERKQMEVEKGFKLRRMVKVGLTADKKHIYLSDDNNILCEMYINKQEFDRLLLALEDLYNEMR